MAADRLSDELIQRIREDEAFRRELLDVLLGEEFLHLPPTVRRIQEALERLIRTLEEERRAATERQRRIDEQIERLGQRSIVLVGLMGAGKSTVGRRLATRDREGLKFYHVDHPSLPSGQAWAAPAGSPTRGAARSGSSGMTRGDTPRRRGARARRR